MVQTYAEFEELILNLELEPGDQADALSRIPTPLVSHDKRLNIFSIGCIAIYHCPWCGSRLPDRFGSARGDLS